MSKHVVVIASGETERRALPWLVRHLPEEDIHLSVSIPPRNGKLTVQMVEKLIKAAYYGSQPPDKFVILIDIDGGDPEQRLQPFRTDLPGRLPAEFGASLQYTYSQWHLEAWYFGDSMRLRGYLEGKALGNVDTSRPDEIHNPKEHLKHLLERVYTARVSEEIASSLDPQTISQRSDSFRLFLNAVKNGSTAQAAS